jgi:coenzyme PQQ precursor peptide PqqA
LVLHYFSWEGEFACLTRRAKMAWKTPKIVEVPVGMEINMYACAARK